MIRSFVAVPLLILGLAASAGAQEEVPRLTDEVVDRFIVAYRAELEERDRVDRQRAEIEDQIIEWRDCAHKFEVAEEVGGGRLGRLGRLASRGGMRAQCGASNEDGFRRDLEALSNQPVEAANSVGGFEGRQYSVLTERILGYMARSRGFTFQPSELEVLERREAQLAGLLASERTQYSFARDGRAGGGKAGPADRPRDGAGRSTAESAWDYIDELFASIYLSGATVLERPYDPGLTTQWELANSCEPHQRLGVERAFLGRDDASRERWRFTSFHYAVDEAGRQTTTGDTAVIEALLQIEGDHLRQLVQARAKLPGQSTAADLPVPQFWAGLWSTSPLGALFEPTDGRIQAATVQTGPLQTPAGSFQARHVRFRAGDGGRVEWWLADDAPGGVARFSHTEPVPEEHGEEAYCAGQPNVRTLTLVGHANMGG